MEAQSNNRADKKLSPYKITFFYAILIFFGLVFAEAFLSFFDRRSILVKSSDEHMVYTFYPDRVGVSSTPEFRTVVNTSASGFRECPSGREAEEGKGKTEAAQIGRAMRIFFLGDSFTEGWGVSCDNSYVNLVGDHFRGKESAVVVSSMYNGGIHGGSAPYYLLRHNHFAQSIKPDITVVQVFDNDLDDMDRFAQFITRNSEGQIKEIQPPGLLFIPPGPVSRFVKETMLYRTVRRAYGMMRAKPLPIKYYRPGREPRYDLLTHEQSLERFGAPQPLKDLNQDYNGQFGFYQYPSMDRIDPESVWHRRFRLMERDLHTLLQQIQKSGSHPVLVYIPAMEVFAPGWIDGSAVDEQGNPVRKTISAMRRENPFYQLLQRLAKRNNTALVDGQEFLHRNAIDLYYPGDAHLNEDGHRRLAEALIPVLDRLEQSVDKR